MSNSLRTAWAVEIQHDRDGEWKVFNVFTTSGRAREIKQLLCGISRVVKYVPAVEPKRAHKKAGGK